MKRAIHAGVGVFLVAGMALAMKIDHYPGPKTIDQLNAGCDYAALLPDRIEDEFYNQSYYHNGVMSDGTVVYVQFMIHNLGFGSFHPSADLTLVTADGKVHHATESYAADDARVPADKFEISFKDHLVSGDPKADPPAYRIRAWFDDVGADLVYTCESRCLIDRGIYFDGKKDKYSKWVTYCPKASIEGTLKTVAKEWKVTGRGFGDHAKSSTLPTGFGDGGYQLYQRGGNSDISVALMESRFLDDGKKARDPNLLVAVGDSNVFFSRDDYVYDIKGIGTTPDGKKFPNAFHVEAKNDWFEMKGDFKMERFLISGSMFDRLNAAFVTMLDTVFDQPGYYRFLSTFEYTYTFEGQTKSGKTQTVSQVIYAGKPDFEIWMK